MRALLVILLAACMLVSTQPPEAIGLHGTVGSSLEPYDGAFPTRDVHCVQQGQYMTRMYVVTPDDAIPSQTVLGEMRGVATQVNHLIHEAALRGGVPAGDMRFDCDHNGDPRIYHLREVGDDEVYSLTEIEDALTYWGHNQASIKHWVYVQGDLENGWAGVARPHSDNSPGIDNVHNGGLRFAAAMDVLDASIWLHEWLHMMGAVQPDAEHATAGYHCTDGGDVMCYDDGSEGSDRFDTLRCGASARFRTIDCGLDTYFHPLPPPGSPLEGTWNIGADYNRFLELHTHPKITETGCIGLVSVGYAVQCSVDISSPAGRDVGVEWEVDGHVQWKPVVGGQATYAPGKTHALSRPVDSEGVYEVTFRVEDEHGLAGPEVSVPVTVTDPDLAQNEQFLHLAHARDGWETGSVATLGDVPCMAAPAAVFGAGTDGAIGCFDFLDLDILDESLLLPTQTSAGDSAAGTSLSFDDGRLAIGVPYHRIDIQGDGTNERVIVGGVRITQGLELLDEIIEPAEPQRFAYFGMDVDLDGDRLAVGAPGASGVPGAVHIFVDDAAGWTSESVITDDSGLPRFGRILSMDGDWLAVGIPDAEDARGQVRMYQRTTDDWVLSAVLAGSDRTSSYFGHDVVLDDERLAVLEVDGPGDVAVVHIYGFDGIEWSLVQSLPGMGERNGAIGGSIDMWQDLLVVGAPTPGGVGIAWYHAEGLDGLWSDAVPVPHGDAQDGGLYGSSVSVRDDRILIGAPGHRAGPEAVGGAFLYDLDVDRDGWRNTVDNCPDVANADQQDLNNDGQGSACDPMDDPAGDHDGDGVSNEHDQCPGEDDALDRDSDGVPDACDDQDDRDSDNDEVVNEFDRCPGHDDRYDRDGDGEPDGCDPYDDRDSDGDGVVNWKDACPNNDDRADIDGDGIADGCDKQDNRDNDHDGVENWQDQCPHGDDAADDDGDGIPDACDDVDHRDDDKDGVVNAEDRCPGSDDSLDVDGDGTPNGCDDKDNRDNDGDGVENWDDAYPDNPSRASDLDGDGDGIDDKLDDNPDDGPKGDLDGDGVPNDTDACPGHDDGLDQDADGVPDGCDDAPTQPEEDGVGAEEPASEESASEAPPEEPAEEAAEEPAEQTTEEPEDTAEETDEVEDATPAPAQPRSVLSVDGFNAQVTAQGAVLTFPPVEDATHYQIWRSRAVWMPKDLVTLDELELVDGLLRYVDASIRPEQATQYRVVAYPDADVVTDPALIQGFDALPSHTLTAPAVEPEPLAQAGEDAPGPAVGLLMAALAFIARRR